MKWNEMWPGGDIGCLVSVFERGEYKSVMGAVDMRNAS